MGKGKRLKGLRRSRHAGRAVHGPVPYQARAAALAAIEQAPPPAIGKNTAQYRAAAYQWALSLGSVPGLLLADLAVLAVLTVHRQHGRGRSYVGHDDIAEELGLGKGGRLRVLRSIRRLRRARLLRQSAERFSPWRWSGGRWKRWRLINFYVVRIPSWLAGIAAGVVKAKNAVTQAIGRAVDKASGRESLDAGALLERRRAREADEAARPPPRGDP